MGRSWPPQRGKASQRRRWRFMDRTSTGMSLSGQMNYTIVITVRDLYVMMIVVIWITTTIGTMYDHLYTYTLLIVKWYIVTTSPTWPGDAGPVVSRQPTEALELLRQMGKDQLRPTAVAYTAARWSRDLWLLFCATVGWIFWCTNTKGKSWFNFLVFFLIVKPGTSCGHLR